MRWILAFCLVLLPALAVAAGPWKFGPGIPVTTSGERIFHHMDAAGRRHVALSGHSVAVVWEDNRAGAPQVYAAFKLTNSGKFTHERRISQGKASYDPVVIGIGDDRFLIAWEQDGAVWVQVATPGRSGTALRLSTATAGQATLAARGRRIYAAWSERQGRHRRVMVVPLEAEKYVAQLDGKPQPADAAPVRADQLYPALAVTRRGLVVAWEDRRHGHTRLFSNYRKHRGEFGKPRFLNLGVEIKNKYDRGSGVTRVVLTTVGKNQVAAAWMDKRARITSGYDIYGAVSHDGGRSFKTNEKIQDPFGDATFHAYPAIAGNRKGQVVVVWNDSRDDNHDLWYSWRNNGKQGKWGNDRTVPAAAGEGEQIKPAVAMDEAGNLHIVWIEKKSPASPTTLWYSLGRFQKK